MCRSFMYSRIRHLLYCQDELAELQKRLLEQDDKDASTTHGQYLLLSRIRYNYHNSQNPQHDLINQIGPKLKQYGKRCRLLLFRVLADTALRRFVGKDSKSCIIERTGRERP